MELSWQTRRWPTRFHPSGGYRLAASARGLVRVDLWSELPSRWQSAVELDVSSPPDAEVRGPDVSGPGSQLLESAGPPCPALEQGCQVLESYFAEGEVPSSLPPLDLERVVEGSGDGSWSLAPRAAPASRTSRTTPASRTSRTAPGGRCAGEFLLEVWRELARLEPTELITYGALAQRLGRTVGSARAVGRAVGLNPLPVLLPCHRVIGQSRQLTGFSAGLELKVRLLRHEGFELSPSQQGGATGREDDTLARWRVARSPSHRRQGRLSFIRESKPR